MKECSPLFILNDKLYNTDKDIYIYGIDENAINIYCLLISYRINFTGFISNEENLISFLLKDVKDLNSVDNENTIILSKNNIPNIKNAEVCTDFVLLNPYLTQKEIYIYGSGVVGQDIKDTLEKRYNINISGFVDSDPNKVGLKIDGLDIYSKEQLSNMSGDIAVIIAGKYWHEIYQDIKNYKFEQFYVRLSPFRYSYIVVQEYPFVEFTFDSLRKATEILKAKKILLYGNNIELTMQYRDIFICIGFKNVSVLDDIEDALYEANFNIVLTDKELQYQEKYIRKSINLGLFEYVCTVNDAYKFGIRKELVDVDLGYSYIMNSDYPGIYIYGNNNKDDIKIAVFGGSTTDSEFTYRIKPWVAYLYDKYANDSVTIYNCGICNYTSYMELVKLTRDVMQLKSDIIITYDGFNDSHNENGRLRMKELLDSVISNITTVMPLASLLDSTYDGFELYENNIQKWLDNIEYMHAIAKTKNKSFYSFIQPMLYSKKYLDPHSKEMLSIDMIWRDKKTINNMREFRRQAPEIVKKHPYIYDLSHIFDNEDVYMDICHVYSHGNEIIADEVWSVIKDEVDTLLKNK